MTLETYRLWLEPDREIPRFKRLRWSKVPVSVSDVLLKGVHPVIDKNACPSLPDAFVNRLNAEDVRVPELVNLGYTFDVHVNKFNGWSGESLFEKTLKQIGDSCYFVDDLKYMELVAIAKERLERDWNHLLAKEILQNAYYGFHELRTFLKSKDKKLKLSSYDDLEKYDLSRVLSVDDFAHADKHLINASLPISNFRKASVIENVTDNEGRLRMMREINHCTVTCLTNAREQTHTGVHIQWHVARKQNMLTFRPCLGESLIRRDVAAEFADKWRSDKGSLVFKTPMHSLERMLEEENVSVSFPSLNYTYPQRNPTASVDVQPSEVVVHTIEPFLDERYTGEQLKTILKHYGVSTTGNKKQLIEKIAEVAEKKYRDHENMMNRYFSENQFIRISAAPFQSKRLQLLSHLDYVGSLVLTMYVLRHLRGNVILDAGHENGSHTVQQLAQALLQRKVGFTGGLIRAV